jgi:hypothetical protein
MKTLITFPKKSGNRLPMHWIIALGSLMLLVSAVLNTGCASSSQQTSNATLQKEALLQKCGFKAVPATTPQQLQQIGTLPPGKISVVQRNWTRYYVFPDPPRKMLYVGRDEQYLLYQNYLSNQAENAQYNAISKEDPSIAKYNNMAEVLSGNVSVAGWEDASWGSWDQ